MIRLSECPSWSKAPFGAVLTVVSFTDGRMPPFFNHRLNDRSRIDRKPLDLCGMAAIGEILS
jgi:hypothetical protein